MWPGNGCSRPVIICRTWTASYLPSARNWAVQTSRSASALADLLGVAVEQVGLQAKTGEEVGPIGREEAVAAQCVVLLSRHRRDLKAGARTAVLLLVRICFECLHNITTN